MAIHCVAAERGGLIKKEKKVYGWSLRISDLPVERPSSNNSLFTFDLFPNVPEFMEDLLPRSSDICLVLVETSV